MSLVLWFIIVEPEKDGHNLDMAPNSGLHQIWFRIIPRGPSRARPSRQDKHGVAMWVSVRHKSNEVSFLSRVQVREREMPQFNAEYPHGTIIPCGAPLSSASKQKHHERAPESQGHNLASNVINVPSSLDSGISFSPQSDIFPDDGRCARMCSYASKASTSKLPFPF